MGGMLELQNCVVIDRPVGCEWLVRQDQKTFEVDLGAICRAEARQEELICARGVSLIELANCFSDGADAASKLFSKTMYEEAMTTIASRKRKSVLMRDIFPQIIKDRGLSSSRSPLAAEDIRSTLLYEDKEYVELEQYRAALECVKELLNSKKWSMTRLCDRAQEQLKSPSTRTGGLGEHDPDGGKMEETMKRVMDEHEIVDVTPSVRKGGFATKERG